jgi:hypothetical protein
MHVNNTNHGRLPDPGACVVAVHVPHVHDLESCPTVTAHPEYAVLCYSEDIPRHYMRCEKKLAAHRQTTQQSECLRVWFVATAVCVAWCVVLCALQKSMIRCTPVSHCILVVSLKMV